MNPLAILGGAAIVGIVALLARKSYAKAKPGGKMHTKDEKLSKNFTAAEWLTSKVAGPALLEWKIPEAVWNNMLRLVTLVLQPARDAVGVPLTITSGYRPPDFRRDGKDFFTLLKEAGYQPVIDSDHMYGLAAGIVPNVPPEEKEAMQLRLFDIFKANPNVRQVILYYKTDPKTKKKMVKHIHVATGSKARPVMRGPRRAMKNIDGEYIPVS